MNYKTFIFMLSSDLLVQALELIVALGSVLSEHMLARGKSSGWIWAILASFLAGIFFLLNGNSVLALVEILNIPFAIYGFQKWKHGIEKVTRTDNIMAFIAIAVVIVYFFNGNSNISETISSGGFLIGGLLIARQKKLGWFINMMADILLVYILLESNDYIFVCFQMLSIGIAIRKTFKNLSTKKFRIKFWTFFIFKYFTLSFLLKVFGRFGGWRNLWFLSLFGPRVT